MKGGKIENVIYCFSSPSFISGYAYYHFTWHHPQHPAPRTLDHPFSTYATKWGGEEGKQMYTFHINVPLFIYIHVHTRTHTRTRVGIGGRV